jgi:hypothetical protein
VVLVVVVVVVVMAAAAVVIVIATLLAVSLYNLVSSQFKIDINYFPSSKFEPCLSIYTALFLLGT